MIYSQETRRIEVIVRAEGNGGGNGYVQGNGIHDPDDDVKLDVWAKLTGSTSKRRQKRVLKTNATHLLAVSRQMFGLALNYNLTGRGYIYGDAAYQDESQRKWEIFTDISSVASSISMGGLYGAWGGPIGSVLGAVLNGASTVTSLAVKHLGRDRDFSQKMFKEDSAISYMRARANINLSTGRLR